MGAPARSDDCWDLLQSLYRARVGQRNGRHLLPISRSPDRSHVHPSQSLSDTARRAGWQGFMIDTDVAAARTVRVSDGDAVEFLVNASRY